MRCRPCDQTMTTTFRPRTLDTAHACGSCGRFVVTRDPGVSPRPNAVPTPFKQLPEEMGWAQESDDVVIDSAPTTREVSQRKRRLATRFTATMRRGAA